MRYVKSWQDGNEVADRMSEYAHSWRELGVLVGRVSILYNSPLELVSVELTALSCVACYQALNRLHTNVCSTIAVSVGH